MGKDLEGGGVGAIERVLSSRCSEVAVCSGAMRYCG